MEETKSVARSAATFWHTILDRISELGAIVYTPLLIGGAVFAYFAQPLVRFLHPYLPYQGAALLTMAMIVVRISAHRQRDPLGIIFGVAVMWLGANWISDSMEEAAALSAKNDQRCAIIETEMLSVRPRRSDLPEIYAALGCRPRTQTDLSLEP